MKHEFDAYIFFAESPHASNDTLTGWAKNIKHHLSIILDRLYNTPVNVGTNLDDNGIINTSLQFDDLLEKSVVLVLQYPEALSIIGHVQKDQTGLSHIASMGKVIKLTTSISKETTNTSWDNLPEVLFCYTDPETNINSVLAADSPETETLYWQKLTDLAYEVKKITEAQVSKKQTGKRSSVYLAETTPDQYMNRDIMVRELTQYSYSIFPDKPLPNNLNGITREIIQSLKQCILSIHIIGGQYGSLIEGSEYSKTELQNKLAAELIRSREESSLVSRLIWMSPELKIKDARQEKFVESLERNPDELSGGEIIQTPLELLKTIITNKLRENKVLQGKTEHDGKEMKRLYLIYEQNEKDSVKPIIQALEKQSLEITLSEATLSKENAVRSHRQNLVENDAILIYYNSANPFWLNSKLKDIIKAPGYGRSKPFMAKALYIGKNIEYNEPLFTQDLQIIKQGNGAFEKDIEPLLKKLH